MFRVGQKVVCVDASPRNTPSTGVCRGEIYTVFCLSHGGLGTVLVEIQSPWNKSGAFWTDRFRPIVERKTDISALMALLNPANHKALEDV